MYKFRSFLVFLICFVGSQLLSGQVLDHTKEYFSLSKQEVKVGDVVDIIVKVDISKDWYIYAIERDEVVTINPAELILEPNATFQKVGDFTAIQPKKKYDDIWEGNYTYFEKHAEFRQTIKVLSKDFKIMGKYSHQTCSNETGQCLPPETNSFTFDNKNIKIITVQSQKKDIDIPEEKKKNDKKEKQKDETVNDVDENSSSDSVDIKENILVTDTNTNNNNPERSKTETVNNTKEKKTKKDNLPINKDETNDSLFYLIITALSYGFFAMLTPCVFPMVPMTVSMFLKQSKSQSEGRIKAFVYGLSIVAIYTVLGVIVAILFGAKFANWLSTHWLPNILFFIIFIIFGLSFLGMFEIVLPSSWVSNADKKADKGGYLGIFFMAFVLVLVSFSCTGPLVGTILVEAASGGFIRPIIGMLCFSTALALPFVLFAMFPSMLKSLPKSGGWLNVVKVVLGFIELALALKFLSTADQVYHWGILNRDIFIAFWVVIFTILGFYLLGKIRLPHDSPIEKLPVPRLILSIVSFTFVVYLLPGMFGAPLNNLSGVLPPQSSMRFNLVTTKQVETMMDRKLEKLNISERANKGEKFNFKNVKHADILHFPEGLGLEGFFDYKEALAYAKKVNKPIFIDFTGHGCVNCRLMEKNVWSDERVSALLHKEYVLVALYVDERKALPENEWYKSSFDNSIIKTVGSMNADIQISKFGNNAQPYYCLLNTNGELMVKPKAYDTNIDNFIKFLEKGIENFEKGITLE